MATSSLIGRRIFLAAASRTSQRTLQTSTFRAASSAIVSTQSSSYNSNNYQTNSNNVSLLAAAGATLTATTAIANNDTNNKAKCCGIAGVVGAKGDARDFLIEGLTILKNRGYDSAGIATMDDVNPSLVRILYPSAHLVWLI